VFTPPAEICRIEVPEQISDEEVEEPHIIIIEPPAALEDIQHVEPSPIIPIILAEPEATSSNNSHTHSRSVSPEERVPKKFKEKKEMYGRDPRKLFETYQEEWDRLERLSDRRHGPRRKSLLNLHDYHESRSPSASPSINTIFRT
ncbi:hypothetical protein ANCDUO_11288, partial [Ancylostoma duodenale]